MKETPKSVAVEVVKPEPKLDAIIPAGTGAGALITALEQARKAIQRARDIDELKRAADFGNVAAAYAKAQRMAEEIAKEATAVRVEALATLAEVWEETPHNTGMRMSGGSQINPPEIETLAQRGLSKNDMATARGLLRLRREQPALFEAVRSGRKSMTGALRAQFQTEPRPRLPSLRYMDALMAHCLVQFVRGEVKEDAELSALCALALADLDAVIEAIVLDDWTASLKAALAEAVRRHPPLRSLQERIIPSEDNRPTTPASPRTRGGGAS